MHQVRYENGLNLQALRSTDNNGLSSLVRNLLQHLPSIDPSRDALRIPRDHMYVSQRRRQVLKSPVETRCKKNKNIFNHNLPTADTYFLQFHF